MRSFKPRLLKHWPQRTCLACRRTRVKGELIRLVRTPDGGVGVDIAGKKDGRGAYFCPAAACWEAGLKGNRLEHSLRAILTPDNRERLLEIGKTLFKE